MILQPQISLAVVAIIKIIVITLTSYVSKFSYVTYISVHIAILPSNCNSNTDILVLLLFYALVVSHKCINVYTTRSVAICKMRFQSVQSMWSKLRSA